MQDRRVLSGASIAAARTVVVIGHGRSPEGKGWGERIDGCDVVIRMWDWHWQPARDYGARFDYGLLEAHPLMMSAFHENVRTSPAIGWVASRLARTDPKLLPGRCEVIDQTPWNEIGKTLGGIGQTGRLQFTRGTIATCWAIERVPAGCRIVLVGFDNIERGVTLPLDDAFSPVYRENPGTFTFNGYRSNATKTGNHDFAIERPVMERLAQDHGVELTFAQAVW